jgi:membrane fusion protein (multidrug efflux system)
MFLMIGRAIAVAATLIVSAHLTVGCHPDATGEAAPTEPPPAPVDTAAVTIDDVEIAVEAVGTLLPNRRVEVRSQAEGVVATVVVADGQVVATGDPLVQLDPTKLAAEVRLREATLAAARARNVSARAGFERGHDLVDKGFIPKQEFVELKAMAQAAAAEVDEADAALALARELLSDADVRAPIPGIAGDTAVDPGDYVRNGDPLLTIVDTDPLEVEFQLPEEHLPKLAVGRIVAVRVPGYPGEAFSATVTFIDPEVKPETHAARLKARIPNPDRRLRPGQFASVHVVLEVHERSTLVPEEAVVAEGAISWIYVVENGRASRRQVDLGVRRDGIVEVTAGLSGTETVVVNGQFRLRDGGPVEARPPGPTKG